MVVLDNTTLKFQFVSIIAALLVPVIPSLKLIELLLQLVILMKEMLLLLSIQLILLLYFCCCYIYCNSAGNCDINTITTFISFNFYILLVSAVLFLTLLISSTITAFFSTSNIRSFTTTVTFKITYYYSYMAARIKTATAIYVCKTNAVVSCFCYYLYCYNLVVV